jgi:hypothetical protein
MKTVNFYARNRRPGDNLHIETDGCVINVFVGLHDSEGRQVTRVDVSPDDETRGGDDEGRIWRQDGPRVIRLHENEGGLVGTAAGKPHGSEYTLAEVRNGTGWPRGARFVLLTNSDPS